jgi:hypothetical protein
MVTWRLSPILLSLGDAVDIERVRTARLLYVDDDDDDDRNRWLQQKL